MLKLLSDRPTNRRCCIPSNRFNPRRPTTAAAGPGAWLRSFTHSRILIAHSLHFQFLPSVDRLAMISDCVCSAGSDLGRAAGGAPTQGLSRTEDVTPNRSTSTSLSPLRCVNRTRSIHPRGNSYEGPHCVPHANRTAHTYRSSDLRDLRQTVYIITNLNYL